MHLEAARLKFPIVSEECEPFAAMIIGKLYARATAVKDDRDEYAEGMRRLWWAVVQLDRLAILADTALHFSLAMGNHRGGVRKMIETEFGIDPEDEPTWQWK